MSVPASEALSKFGLTLFQHAVSNSEHTVMMCPAAAAASLLVAAACAKGDTAAELATALGSSKNHELQTAIPKLLATLSKPSGNNDMAIVHRVFLDKAVSPNPSFVKSTLEDKYACGVTTAQFRTDQESAAETVNAWLSEATDSKLRGGFLGADSIDPDCKMLLASAFYFRGFLDPPFVECLEKRVFTPNLSTRIEVDTIYSTGNFLHGELEDPPAKVLELPYRNRDTSLLILLPDRVPKIKDLKAKLSPPFLKTVIGSLSKKAVRVELPKTTVESQMVLNTHLFKMAVRQAFMHSAEFNNLVPAGGVRLSNIVHKAVIVFDEGVPTGGRPPAPPKEIKTDVDFVVTRPFIFVLRRPSDEHVLLLGVVRDIKTSAAG